MRWCVMIALYTGWPGSGKSYNVIKSICDNLLKGRTIYTNLDGLDDSGCIEAIKALTGLDDYQMSKQLNLLNMNSNPRFWLVDEKGANIHQNYVKGGSLLIIDEVHKWYGARAWNAKAKTDDGNLSEQLLNFASTHRHYGYDVIFLTQDADNVDVAIRRLAEWTHNFRKINFLGGAVQHKYIEFVHVGTDTSKSPLAKHVRTYDSKYFNCYKSYSATDVKEKGIGKATNILKHPVFFIIPLVICFALYMFFAKSSFATGDIFGSKAALARASKITQPLPVQRPFSSVRSGSFVPPVASPVALSVAPVYPFSAVPVSVPAPVAAPVPAPVPVAVVPPVFNSASSAVFLLHEERARIDRILPGGRVFDSYVEINGHVYLFVKGKKVDATGCTIDEDEKLFSCKKV